MMIVVMILVLSFEKKDLKLQTHSQALFCYGTTVGFSIIVSVDILKKLFMKKKPSIDKMEILNNVLAVILFTVVGFTRVHNYKENYSEEKMWKDMAKKLEVDQVHFSKGEICLSHRNIS